MLELERNDRRPPLRTALTVWSFSPLVASGDVSRSPGKYNLSLLSLRLEWKQRGNHQCRSSVLPLRCLTSRSRSSWISPAAIDTADARRGHRAGRNCLTTDKPSGVSLQQPVCRGDPMWSPWRRTRNPIERNDAHCVRSSTFGRSGGHTGPPLHIAAVFRPKLIDNSRQFTARSVEKAGRARSLA